MSLQIIQEVNDQLLNSINGIFATRESCDAASKYATELITSSAPEQLPNMIGMALQIYHNTLINQVGIMVDGTVKMHMPWSPVANEDGSWARHDDHPECDWVADVCNGYTQQGYIEWVNSRISEEALHVGEEFVTDDVQVDS